MTDMNIENALASVGLVSIEPHSDGEKSRLDVESRSFGTLTELPSAEEEQIALGQGIQHPNQCAIPAPSTSVLVLEASNPENGDPSIPSADGEQIALVPIQQPNQAALPSTSTSITILEVSEPENEETGEPSLPDESNNLVEKHTESSQPKIETEKDKGFRPSEFGIQKDSLVLNKKIRRYYGYNKDIKKKGTSRQAALAKNLAKKASAAAAAAVARKSALLSKKKKVKVQDSGDQNDDSNKKAKPLKKNKKNAKKNVVVEGEPGIVVKKKRPKSSKCQLFFCDKCDKVYDQYSELVYHKRRHTGEKPYVCVWTDCKQAFSTSNARVRHLRTHTGERPYACPFANCDRNFKEWKDLKTHKLRHTGEKPYKCEWEGCTSCFFRKENLKHHIYTHTGEKPYKCTYPGCSACFSQKAPLNIHVRRIHKKEDNPKTKNKNNVTQQLSAQQLSGSEHQEAGPSLVLVPTYPTQNNNINNHPATITYQTEPIHLQHLQNSTQVSYNSSMHNYQGHGSHDNSIYLTCNLSPNNVPFTTLNRNSHQWNQAGGGGGNFSINEIDLLPNIQESESDTAARILNNSAVQFSENTSNVIEKCHEQENVSYKIHDTNPTEKVTEVELAESENDEEENGGDNVIFNSHSDNPTNSDPSRKVATQINSSVITVTSLRDPALSSTDPTNDRNKIVQAIILPKALRRRKRYRLKEQTEEGKCGYEIEVLDPKKKPKTLRKRNNYRLKAQAEGVNCSYEIEVLDTTKKPKFKKNSGYRRAASRKNISIQTTKHSLKKEGEIGPFLCDVCKRPFKVKHDRDSHRMTHTGEKPRICDFPGCDYRCINKGQLLRHKRKHTGEKNYACDWADCHKKFLTNTHLVEHRRCHTGEKPFKCDFPGCDKSFKRRDHIKNHRFKHTGEKPRKCTFPGCDSAFIQLGPLKKHMELHQRDGGLVSCRKKKPQTFSVSNQEEPTRDQQLEKNLVNSSLGCEEQMISMVDMNSHVHPQAHRGVVLQQGTQSCQGQVQRAGGGFQQGASSSMATFNVAGQGQVQGQVPCAYLNFPTLNQNHQHLQLDYDMIMQANYS